jgi:predicted ester cyclase
MVVLLMIGGKCSHLRAKTGHISGHLPLTPGGEIAPTGRRVELQISEIYQMKDGKIRLLRAYYDAVTMMRQLGLMP